MSVFFYKPCQQTYIKLESIRITKLIDPFTWTFCYNVSFFRIDLTTPPPLLYKAHFRKDTANFESMEAVTKPLPTKYAYALYGHIK